jgi:glycolate oxidase FAD binding subunit
MAETLRPESESQVEEAVRWAAAEEKPFDVVGRATKRGFGRPPQAALSLDLSLLSGVTLYEPGELVLTARAATPLAEIGAALEAKGQQLAFEPADLGPLWGGAPEAATIGGAIACNLGGPRRIKAGAARDFVLGFRAVSGRGESFKSGGRVMKNVTGFDLSKLMAGSFGTLAVMTEITLKVLPAAEKTRTVLVFGLADEAAMAAMAEALTSPHEVGGAAHLPADLARQSAVSYVAGAAASVTALRVEGPGPSVAARCEGLLGLLRRLGPVEELHTANSRMLWKEIADVRLLAGKDADQIWRISVPPARGAEVARELGRAVDGRLFYDWGGGLLWLAMPPRPDAGAAAVRSAIMAAGGHATLVRAADAVRAAVPVFQPQPKPLADLTARVKAAFDPKRVLNPGRMYAGV